MYFLVVVVVVADCIQAFLYFSILSSFLEKRKTDERGKQKWLPK